MRGAKKPMTKRRIALWSLLGTMLIIGSVAGYYVYSIVYFAGEIRVDDPNDSIFSPVTVGREQTEGQTQLEPPKWESKERVNILLLGGDSRGISQNEVPRSDAMMVVSLDPVSKKSYMFSLLRDTYVSIPDYGMGRINTALSRGGPELAMKTASDLMGIPIQYYVYTDFLGFIALIDSIGGVWFEVEKDMQYGDSADENRFDINLEEGYQLLDGNKALQYVRFRNDAMSDYTRTERQREFLKALMDKMQSTSSLIRLPSILQKIEPYIETNLKATEIVRLATVAFEVRTDGIVTQQIPPSGLFRETRINGAEVLEVNPEKIQQFIEELFEEEEAAEAEETPTPTPTPTRTPSSVSRGNQSASGTVSSQSATSRPASTPAATAAPTPVPSAPPADNSARAPAATPAATSSSGGQSASGVDGAAAESSPAPAATARPGQSPAREVEEPADQSPLPDREPVENLPPDTNSSSGSGSGYTGGILAPAEGEGSTGSEPTRPQQTPSAAATASPAANPTTQPTTQPANPTPWPTRPPVSINSQASTETGSGF